MCAPLTATRCRPEDRMMKSFNANPNAARRPLGWHPSQQAVLLQFFAQGIAVDAKHFGGQ
jgi:hypothetical protein